MELCHLIKEMSNGSTYREDKDLAVNYGKCRRLHRQELGSSIERRSMSYYLFIT